jgi:hypothetical protein
LASRRFAREHGPERSGGSLTRKEHNLLFTGQIEQEIERRVRARELFCEGFSMSTIFLSSEKFCGT